MRGHGFLFGVTLLGLTAPAGAGLLDESDCLNGPTNYGSSVSSMIGSVDKRVVACYNLQLERAKRREQDLNATIRLLNLRIDALESDVSLLRKLMDRQLYGASSAPKP